MKYLYLLLLLTLLACHSKNTKKEASNKEKETIDLQKKIAFCAPVLSDKQWFQTQSKAPVIEGLDVLDWKIQTENELVQTYFNQGLMLAFGFNHAEAARSFYYATQLDSTSAMALWGFAYVLGPNYNAGMEPDNYERAYAAIQKALQLPTSNSKEKDLIAAMAKRYVREPIEDRFALDVAYADAMAVVFKKYPDDPTIGTLYVESLMDLYPWNIWDKNGAAQEWTPQILAIFDQIFELDAVHPGAHHLYIHAIEASSTPEKGLKSAQLYDEGLVPGAGHLVHMPAHIYIRTGDYHKGTLANLRSLEVDSAYLTSCHAQGTYPLTLYPHNFHFLTATATMEGNSAIAIEAAQKVANHANRQLMQEPGWGTIQHYYTIPWFVLVKFGKWEAILKRENTGVALPYPRAIKSFARGMAFNAQGNLKQAKSELQLLQKFASEDQFKEITIWGFNSTHDLLQIAQRVLEAEILATEGQYDSSIKLLQEAVDLEDALDYQEPPDWFFSVRHHLGAVQVEAGRNHEAIKTYQDDLNILPKNGWALHGMKKAFSNLNEDKSENRIGTLLETIWAHADTQLSNSRIK